MSDYIVTINNRKRKVIIEEDHFVQEDRKIPFELNRLSTNLYLFKAGDKVFEICAKKISEEKMIVTLGGMQFEVVIRTALQEKAARMLELRSDSKNISEIKSPMPGLILKVRKKKGEEVEAGEPVLILEAMKMENEVRSPSKGKVKEIMVKEGFPVEKGTVLFMIE